MRFAQVGDELGLSRHTRLKLIRQELVTPVDPVIKGRPTFIPDKDAEDMRRAWNAAAVCGLSIVIVLKVLKAL